MSRKQDTILKFIASASFAVIIFLAFLFAKIGFLPSILIVGVLGGLIYFFKDKISFDLRRKFNENLAIIITGFFAFSIMAFVIYLLYHISSQGSERLTWEFLTTSPAEGLTEGGIFPAIVGTAALVIIMSLVGVPIGTITAIYLTEYASEKSILARIIRFAVNTLAGVPSIVFGLFGLGFFIGVVGKQMDTQIEKSKMNSLTAIFASKDSPFADDGKATGLEIKSYLGRIDANQWAEQIELSKIIDEMKGSNGASAEETMKFFKERTRPHWGQPALIWAALTMALLTLPVVIVSVEEAIKTVPKELREASLALGATKFATIVRVVLPGSITGILTGAILAVSRGAGEVAPILFTGAAYYLPDLPTSVSSQFMELGYHIYILTTQSTNVDLTKPLQYATTMTLLLLTFMLNFSAIFLRSKIRSRQAS